MSENPPIANSPSDLDVESKLEPALYVVATPIGNLKDITLRALEVLSRCDLILCEDTRVTRKLMNRYNIKKPLESVHEHNEEHAIPKIMDRLNAGQAICLVSDAGTPLISDPGYRLVKSARNQGCRVLPVPGASALTASISISGLPSDQFTFVGFLPTKGAARRKAIAQLAQSPVSAVIYESPRRLNNTLRDLADQLGAREAFVCRELTKMFEQHYSGCLTELCNDPALSEDVKGECVIVIGPPSEPGTADFDLERALIEAMKTSSLRDAVAEVTEVSGFPRRVVYEKALSLKDESDAK